MTNKVRSYTILACVALLAGLVAPACSSDSTGDRSGETADGTGTVGLELTLDSGVVLTSVEFVVSGGALPEGETVTGTIPVAGELAEISAYIGGLPEGTGYTITLSADSVDGATHCVGTATFDVVAGATTTGVNVYLECDAETTRGAVSFSTTLNNCPVFTSVTVAPQLAQSGEPVNVHAVADDSNGESLTYNWAADYGSFVSATADTTVYNCVCPPGAASPCNNIITVSVSDDACTSSEDITVQCTSTAVCGDGEVVPEQGEQCEPPNTDVCNEDCQNIVCGDGRTDSVEACDPGPNAPNGTATCTGTAEADGGCHLRPIVCGDGWVQEGEDCDAGSTNGAVNETAVCLNTCDFRPPECGDGWVTPPETCDPLVEVPGQQCFPAGHVDENGNLNECTIDGRPACDVCQDDYCGVDELPAVEARCSGDWANECSALRACYEQNGCGAPGGDDPLACFCGSYDSTDCFVPGGNYDGPCSAEVFAIANTTDLTTIGTQWTNFATPLGAINQLLFCQIDNCADQCFTPAP